MEKPRSPLVKAHWCTQVKLPVRNGEPREEVAQGCPSPHLLLLIPVERLVSSIKGQLWPATEALKNAKPSHITAKTAPETWRPIGGGRCPTVVVLRMLREEFIESDVQKG